MDTRFVTVVLGQNYVGVVIRNILCCCKCIFNNNNIILNLSLAKQTKIGNSKQKVSTAEAKSTCLTISYHHYCAEI